MSNTAKIIRHYGRSDIRLKLEATLKEARLGDGDVSPADLAPLDQFHTRGLAATVELAEAAGVERGAVVIDIGSGLGGPSRYLATKFGCRVHGVDLNPAFVEAATWLADRTGLSDKVSYDCADAEALPCQEGCFDLAWTQHVAMNIANRARLYGEVHRVLRSGARFAIYDVVAGTGGPVHFPVPWSRGPETSFLLTPDAMLATLEQAGFRAVDWQDRSEAGIAWFERRGERRIRGGRRKLRNLLYMPIMGAATQHNPVLKAYYQRLLAKGKKAKVSLMACMRKLIGILNTMLNRGEKWDPTRHAIA